MFLKRVCSVACFSALICLGGLFTSCQEKKGSEEVAINQQVSTKQTSSVKQEEKKVEKTEEPKRDSRFADVDSVLSKMTKRFKGEVHISESQYGEFLADLERALLTEKDNASDDISLFFLIDKTHYAGEDKGANYAPVHRTTLKNCSSYSVNKDGLSLRDEAAEALKILGDAAKKDGINLVVSSTYRSYSYQKQLFQHWVDVDGLEEAERESARAGTSQHQLGVAVDFAPVNDGFANTKAGDWMYKNGQKYGWSLSFPKDHEDVTGYRWESWHFRYLGKPAIRLQEDWFFDVQQYMLEFIAQWKKTGSYKTFAKENGIPNLLTVVEE